jgi:hypothetical protein
VIVLPARTTRPFMTVPLPHLHNLVANNLQLHSEPAALHAAGAAKM